MRKNILICILFAFLRVYLFAQQEVTLNEIKTAGAHYLSVYNSDRIPYGVSDISSVSYITRRGKPAIYEVLFQNGNTVLLSGSKACIPVLGCNFSGTGETVVNNDDLPPGLQAMLDVMLMDIDSVLLNDTITLYHEAEWDELLSADFPNKKNITGQHGPLLTSAWGQSRSNDRINPDTHAYNYSVDSSHSCGNYYCSAGCVAVAMAQILYYWKHPWNRGVYDYYDWCNMPDSLMRNNNPCYKTERDAVAKLIRDCGILVDTKYCDGGCSSGAETKDARNAFVYNFLYSIDADYRRKFWWPRKWKGFIKDDINAGRPVMYRGQGSEGHAFVCDGYRDGDLFHFNWGWNGTSNNLWLTVDDITPGSSNYNKRQAAIFEIHPNMSYYVNYCNAQVNLPAIYTGCVENGITDFWNIVPPTGRVLESCNQSLPAEWRTIPSGESSEYTAFERVVLNPGFTAEEGSNFVASIRECPNCNGTIMLKSTEQGTEPENSKKLSDSGLFTGTEQSDTDGISVYPNPTTGEIIIKTAGMVEHGEIQVINGLGSVIRTEKINGNLTSINLSELTSGIYYLMITAEGKTVSRKIIKQ